MKKIIAIMLVLAASVGFQSSAKAQESSDPIRLALNDWSSQQVLTQITGKILQSMGYNVELVTAGYYPQMEALETGELTATMEIWTDNVPTTFQDQVDSGKINIAGSIGFKGEVGWWYPTSFEKTCPGLPGYQALLKCQDQLVTEDTFPNPRFVEYPADWGNTFNMDRFAAFGFDFQTVAAGSDGALVAEMKASQASGDPLIIMMYSPNAVFADVDFKRIAFPEHSAKCEKDASWGVNADKTYDCGFPTADILKITWPGMEDKWPKAYKLLQEMSLTLDQDLALIKAADTEGIPQDKIVTKWLADNAALWNGWVSNANM